MPVISISRRDNPGLPGRLFSTLALSAYSLVSRGEVLFSSVFVRLLAGSRRNYWSTKLGGKVVCRPKKKRSLDFADNPGSPVTLLGVCTVRSSDPPVGPTQATSDCLSDQSDRPVGQTVAEPPTSVNQINVAC